MKLTKNFTIEELTKSQTAQRLGIDNTPNDEQFANLKALCRNILQPLREAYGKPIVISSGFRCEELNKAIGGSKTSEHRYGMAADIHSLSDTRKDNKELFELIFKMELPYTQLIDEYEYDWIHVSYNPKSDKHEKLKARKVGKKTQYLYIK